MVLGFGEGLARFRYIAFFTPAIIVSLLLFAALAAVARGDDELRTMVLEFNIPAAQHAAYSTPASGQQIYRCTRDGDAFAWQLSGIDAKLFDADGKEFAKQSLDAFVGLDGTSLKSSVAKTVPSATGTLPDLLYNVTQTSAGGWFPGTTSIVRTAVTGGLPPIELCDAASAGHVARVPFKAEYTFFQTAQ